MGSGIFAFGPTVESDHPDDLPIEILDDPPRDPTISGQTADVGVLSASVDVVKLRVVSETVKTLRVALSLQAFDLAPEADTSPVIQRNEYLIRFALEPHPEVSYRVHLTAYMVLPPGTSQVRLRPGPVQVDFANGSTLHPMREVRVEYRDETNEVLVDLPKAGLAGRFVQDLKHRRDLLLLEGNRLAAFAVEAIGYDLEGTGYVRDRAPAEGSGGLYVLRHNAESTVLQVRISAGATLPLLPSANQSVTFTVANLAPEKRTIDLRYEVRGDAESAHGFTVTGPGSLWLPPRQWRNYTIAVATPSTVPERSLQLVIVAQSRASVDTGYAVVTLQQGFRFEAHDAAFFFHAARVPPNNEFSEAMCGVGTCTRSFISELRQDPERTPDVPLRFGAGGATHYMEAPRPLAEPLALDPQGRVELRLKLAMKPAGHESVRVSAVLQAVRATDPPTPPLTVATLSGEWAIAADPVVRTLRGPVQLQEDGTVPTFARFRLLLQFSLGEDTVAFANALVRQIEVVPAESHLKLPAVPLPEHLLNPPNASPFQISIQSEREEFVNPGKSRLFNLTITNIDALAQRLRVTATPSDASWHVRVLPGTEFELEPGVGIPIGVLVRAPEDASEGSRINVTFEASPDAGEVRVAILQLTATTSTDLEDDKDKFVADPDAVENLIQKPTDTPTEGFFLLLATILGALHVIRRRR